MSTVSRRLYQLIADVVRAHSGPEALADELYGWVADEVESLAAARFDEQQEHDPSSAYTSDRRGHTEHEAAQRWCPHARETVPLGKAKKDIAIGNRYMTDRDDYTNPAGCRCIGSHCAAWRWATGPYGFCGLAGPVGPMPRNEPRDLPNRIPPARLAASPPQSDLFDAGGHRHDSADLSTSADATESKMPTKGDVFPSKYLKAADLTGPVTLEIKSAPVETLTSVDGKAERKTVLYFTATSKKFPLNRTNWDAIVDVTGEANSDNWTGKRIEFFPSTTEVGGREVPCIRIRTPKVRAAAMAGKSAPLLDDLNDEIPDFAETNKN